ncbi:MAG TPA: DNRLRE domain-containing protein [Terriglobales bacterium]
MNNLKMKLSWFSILLVNLCALTAAYAQITPSGDSYTNTADPTTNYGAKTLLDVESALQTAYIQFNLSSIPAGYTSADITKATLKLYVNTVTKAGSFNVDYVNGTWSEGTIDANNAPALGSTIAASVPLTTADKNQYILIDITTALQAWLNGTETNYGIALVGNSPLNASFDSKESTTTSHAAELDIVFAGGGGGGITGITTASGSGLIGGGTSGTLNLSLLTTCSSGQVLSWSGSAWACTTVKGTGTVTSVGSGLGLTGGPITTRGTLSIDTTAVPLLASYNKFTIGQEINTSGNSDGLDAFASGTNYNGVYGLSSATSGTSAGVLGISTSITGYGVYGASGATGGTGVYGTSSGGFAVYGNASGVASIGVYGSGYNEGVYGTSATGFGLDGFGITGVAGESYVCCSGFGGAFYGFNAEFGSGQNGTTGVFAEGGFGDPYNVTGGGAGVYALGGNGTNSDGQGGFFEGADSSAYGDGIDAVAGSGYAGFFNGNVDVAGAITATTKDFRIDHPLDPANKYLVHASVESSEMMNIYTGNVTTDAQGGATVQLPEWFQTLNTDFRYQLTVIGQFAQAIVAHKIENNQFAIRTNASNVEVSWQVTGVRQDAYAKAHPLVVEEEKDARLKGFYIHPDLYGAPQEKQIEWARHPEMMKQMNAKREAHPARPSSPRTPVPPLRATPAVGAGK